jgi:hypothetical protein
LRLDLFDEALSEGVVDAVLHQDAVGAHAGLAGVAVLRGDRTLDRSLDIGVVEDDERGVAAQFERELFDRAGALLHQQFPDLGRAGEGQFADDRVQGEARRRYLQLARQGEFPSVPLAFIEWGIPISK